MGTISSTTSCINSSGELVSMGECCLNWQIVLSKCFYKQLIIFRGLNFKLLCQTPEDEAIL